MDMKLEAVTITRLDSCLTFALKRIGIAARFPNPIGKEFFKFADKRRIKSFDDLPIGSLLAIKHPKEVYTSTLTITEAGQLIYQDWNASFHFMVYEGDLLSDLTYGENSVPYIRLREKKEFNLAKGSSKWYVLTEPK